MACNCGVCQECNWAEHHDPYDTLLDIRQSDNYFLDTVSVKIKKLHPDAVLPSSRGADKDAGYDLSAIEDFFLLPHCPKLAKTGLAISMPPGVMAEVRSRSGLALKQGVQVYNAPGTVDSSYRGELGVILCWNGFNPPFSWAVMGEEVECDSPEMRTVRGQYLPLKYLDIPCKRFKKGDRIAQLVFSTYLGANFQVLDELDETERGAGGFGSTGV